VKQRDFVTASEIGEYVYCPRVWWLNRQAPRKTLPIMTAGITRHDALFHSLRSMRYLTKLLQILILSGLVLVVFCVLWLVFFR
jgi:hypothetical protein